MYKVSDAYKASMKDSLRERGYKSVVLSTDDERIPALTLYYSLGFRPVYSHESHKARWEAVLPLIAK